MKNMTSKQSGYQPHIDNMLLNSVNCLDYIS